MNAKKSKPTKRTSSKSRIRTPASKCPFDELFVYPDYSASGVWTPRFECIGDLRRIGVPQRLIAQFRRWIRDYEDENHDEDKHRVRGRELAIALKHALPAVRVIYWHEFWHVPEAERPKSFFETVTP